MESVRVQEIRKNTSVLQRHLFIWESCGDSLLFYWARNDKVINRWWPGLSLRVETYDLGKAKFTGAYTYRALAQPYTLPCTSAPRRIQKHIRRLVNGGWYCSQS